MAAMRTDPATPTDEALDSFAYTVSIWLDDGAGHLLLSITSDQALALGLPEEARGIALRRYADGEVGAVYFALTEGGSVPLDLTDDEISVLYDDVKSGTSNSFSGLASRAAARPKGTA